MDAKELENYIIGQNDVFDELIKEEKVRTARDILAIEKNCHTCIHENGILCDSALGSCKMDYEHYEPKVF